jgi:hypothetical protein
LRATSFGAFLRVSQAPAKQLPDRANAGLGSSLQVDRSQKQTH